MEWSFGQSPGIGKRAWSMRSHESKGSEALIISLWWVEFFFWDREQLKIMLQESEESVVESFCWAYQTVRISQCWVILSFWKNELAGKCGVHAHLTSGSQKSKNKSKNLLWTAGCLPVLSGNPLEKNWWASSKKTSARIYFTPFSSDFSVWQPKNCYTYFETIQQWPSHLSELPMFFIHSQLAYIPQSDSRKSQAHTWPTKLWHQIANIIC